VVSRIREIQLWGDGSLHGDLLGELASTVGDHVSEIPIHAKGNLWDRIGAGSRGSFAQGLARARVVDLDSPLPGGNAPLRGEVAYEEGRITGRNRSTGLLYDGYALSSTLRLAPGIGEGTLDRLPVVLTDRLIGTFDRFDRRYHARIVVFGYPHVLSTTGVVEAPARPREYYLLKRRYHGIGPIPPDLLEPLRGRYLEHGDPRTVEVLKGYVLQCLFYQATGDPFCEESGCCLFNAHWQEEMIRAQLGPGEDLCARHRGLLNSFCRAGERVETPVDDMTRRRER
jgi:hypothetical protein